MNGQPGSAGFEGDVHVVEFWATWCGPCLVSMPHLSELKQEYGDQVTIIGITNEDEGTVEAFLASESPDGRSWFQVIQYYLGDRQPRSNQRGLHGGGRTRWEFRRRSLLGRGARSNGLGTLGELTSHFGKRSRAAKADGPGKLP